MRSRVAFLFLRALALAGTAAFAAFVVAISMRLTVTRAVPTDSINPEKAAAFTAGVPGGFARTTDSSAAPGASRLELFEDGRPLGPAHSIHDDIRKLGKGRYSDWMGSLRFSASDNSDPRSNGRAYSVRYPVPRGSAVPVPISKGTLAVALAAAAVLVVVAATGRRAVPTESKNPAPSGGGTHRAGAAAKILGLALIYAIALVLILAAYRARQSTAGGFRINFEYKVF